MKTKTNFTRSLAVSLALTGGGWVAAEPTPNAKELLEKTVGSPSVAYQGVMSIGHWHGSQSKMEDVNVHFKPPRQYRWEFLSSDGTINRVVVSNGVDEIISIPRLQRTFTGSSAKAHGTSDQADKEWGLLLANYAIAMDASENFIGRPVWRVSLTPKIAGKLHQTLWIDKQSGIILENKKFSPEENFAVLTRFTRIEFPETREDPSVFEEKGFTQKSQHDLDPDFMSIKAVQKATGNTTPVPEQLPNGFAFESADFFNIGKNVITHVRYTDGVSVVSVFRTNRPVQMKKDPETDHVVRLTSGPNHFTLISDVSEKLLSQLAAIFK